MRLLNVGCGGHRPQEDHWWNLDCLRQFLKPGTPERTNLDMEPRYIECDLATQSIPLPDESVDGILCQHVLEHFTCHDAVEVVAKCRRVLKPGGWMIASVPDTDYFIQVHNLDDRHNAEKLFGEPISEPEHETFFSYALFHREHKQLLTKSGVKALFYRAGFSQREKPPAEGHEMDVMNAMVDKLNRLKFSAVVGAYKDPITK